MTHDLRLPFLVTGVIGVVVSVRIAAGPLVSVELPRSSVDRARLATGAVASRVPTESVAAVVSRDPFRVERRPVLPPYDPLRLAEQLAPPPPRPALVLVGVMDGSSPSAVIEGMPGVEGSRVVRAGDVVGGLRVKMVRSKRVVITGMDTTWVLEVREPWKP